MGAIARIIARLGGMVVSPRRTFARLLAGEGDPLEPLALYLVVQLAIVARLVYKSVLLFPEAPSSVARRLFVDAIWRRGSMHADVAILLVIAGVVAAYARWLAPARIPPRHTVEAVSYLLVPTTVMMAVGLIARLMGLEMWALAHTALDSRSVLVATTTGVEVSWVRFGVKALVAYGWSFAILVLVLRDLWRPASAEHAKGDVVEEAGSIGNSDETAVENELTPPTLAPSPSRFRNAVGASLVVGIIGLAVLGSAVDVAIASQDLRPLLRGDPVPKAQLRWLSPTTGPKAKGRFDPTAYRGKTLVIDFWASWCAPCRRAIPELNKIAADYADNVVVVGVNREPRNRAEARAALDQLKFGFPSAIDHRGGTSSGFGEKIGLQSLPTTIVVDREGIVRGIHLGYKPPSMLRGELDALLASP